MIMSYYDRFLQFTKSSKFKDGFNNLKKRNFMPPFYGWGSTTSMLEPLWGGRLLFTTKFPEIPGTHIIDHGRMKGWVDLGAA